MFPNFTRSAALVSLAAGLFGLTLSGAAYAESVRKQCSAKYQAAKAANTLNGQSWNQFYSQCASEAKASDTPPATAATAPTASATAAPAAPAPTPAVAEGSVRSQCSAKYQAAKAANTLNGQKWNQFYSQCAAEANAADKPLATPAATAPAPKAEPAVPAPTPAASAPPPAAPKPTKTVAAPSEPEAPPSAAEPAAQGTVVYPTAISPQYANLSPGAARRKTCDDQYKINKPNNANGGLIWTQKGGGYYHECNNRLKGEN